MTDAPVEPTITSVLSRPIALLLFAAASLFGSAPAWAQSQPVHNVILIVPDGLRALMVNTQNAPALTSLRERGVTFTNSHSLFPTFTMANGSAMATGHYLGDTGVFSNTIFAGFPVVSANGAVTPFIENDAVLAELDEHFGGNFLDETTLLAAARAAGYSTAAVGKLGPTLDFDHTARSGRDTIIVDDSTGSAGGVALNTEMTDALTRLGLPLATPKRGDNGKAGDATTPGTTVADVAQLDYLTDVVTKVVLPMFKARQKPFVLVFWSRDPDGTQHNQGDSLNRVKPGINGPTSLAAIRNVDNDVARIEAALVAEGLSDSTDIVVSADHGFSTISKESATSGAAKATYADVPAGFLPPGFLALDIADALGLPVFDPNAHNAFVPRGAYPRGGSALIGNDPEKPDVVVAANGGSDLIYLPHGDRQSTQQVIDALMAQDYVSGVFVDDALGSFAGTLPLSSVNLLGAASTPTPAIAVNFRSYATDCGTPTNCSVEVADTGLQQGQGMHGSFGRGDTFNFMAAIGPDFKAGFVDGLPVSNADVGKTLASLLKLDIPIKGHLVGRVMTEAMPRGFTPKVKTATLRSPASTTGLRTILQYQQVGETRYFDAAGFPGRSVGIK